MKSVNKNFEIRQRKLQAWATEHGESLSSLARYCGVSPSYLTAALQRWTLSRKCRDRLIAFGVPESLLPTAWQRKADLVKENLELKARLARYESVA